MSAFGDNEFGGQPMGGASATPTTAETKVMSAQWPEQEILSKLCTETDALEDIGTIILARTKE